MSNEQIVYLDPLKVLADDNSRFSTRDTNVEGLMASILEHDGVMEPVEVEPLAKDDKQAKKFTHRLTFGHGRHAALLRLNAEQSAGLELPAIVRESSDPASRIKRQVAENLNRAELSPMDRAVAIKRLMDNGVERGEVRRIFASTHGRKGNKVQDMSNAMLNILLNLLDLPKPIQQDIHEGVIGIEGAYMLGKVSPDKRQAVIDQAKAARDAKVTAEEKDEAKLLKGSSKVEEAEAKITTAAETILEAREGVATAEALVKERTLAVKVVMDAQVASKEPSDKKSAEALKAVQADHEAAKKALKDAKAKLEKAVTSEGKAKLAAEDAKKKFEEARTLPKKKKSIGKTDVKKAAKAIGVDPKGNVPLTLKDIINTVNMLAKGKSGADGRTAFVAEAFRDCFNGGRTEKELALYLNESFDTMGASLSRLKKPEPAKAAAKK